MKSLQEKNFFALLIAQFFGTLNDNILRTTFTTALAFNILSTENSANLIYLSLAIFILPFILFSSIAGQIADKFSKKKLVVYLKLIDIFICNNCFLFTKQISDNFFNFFIWYSICIFWPSKI